jgi:flagellar biosynthesis protein FlhF
MRLKSYFSGTVEAAIALARKELGEEALLIHARPATPETKSLGAFEVVFGTVNSGAPAPGDSQPATPEKMSREIAELRQQLEMLAGSVRAMLSARADPAPAAAEAEVDAPVPARPEEVDAPVPARPESEMGILERIKSEPRLGHDDAAPAVAAFVGSPGGGKTTTLVKIAARYGLSRRRGTHIITADTNRIAAADQLRCLCSILGIGCTVAETPLAVLQAIEEHAAKDLILIDTPGFARSEIGDAGDLAAAFLSQASVDVHLVLPACLKPDDFAAAMDAYRIFRPRRLVLTKLDETIDAATALREAAVRGLPISFLANGQRIPDDLLPSSKEVLTEYLKSSLHEPAKALRAAA